MSRAGEGDVPMHQIGEVAEQVGLSLRTIRHYEEVGLVPPSGRSAGGFRLYTDADIDLLHLVKQMKPLDFRLEEMRELLDIRRALAAGGTSTARRRALTEQLEQFAIAAEARCRRLHEELERAEAFATALREQLVDTATERSRRRGAVRP